MVTWEGIVVLIVAAHRCTQLLRQFHRSLYCSRENHTGAVQQDREFGLGQNLGRLLSGTFAARGALQLDARGQWELHHLCPEVSRNVDLCRGTAVKCLLDHTVQYLADARMVSDLLLIAHAILKHGHLFHFLKSTLADCLVGCLRGNQQQWGMIPVSRLHRRHKVGDTRSILGDHHGHLPGSPGVAIRHHSSIALMRTIPEFDACSWEEI
mmetsp:Transcript_80301/g.126735  ORF Transcript_80301/g.126735 Transcript_80301/m.126735 type:complete len:210 (-) Transcript_80301:255-884(-)